MGLPRHSPIFRTIALRVKLRRPGRLQLGFGLIEPFAHLQMSLNGSGLIAVYLTVLVMLA